jgi:aspartate carbamoyltransferase catalytic subunit
VTIEVLSRPSSPALLLSGQIQPVRHQRKNVLDLDDFSVQEIEAVLETAAAMKDVLSRPIKKVPTLRGKTLVTMFYEASTRTRVAFEVAAKALGADTVNVAAQASSVTKGESLIDTIRTLQALGADFVVMRHYQAGAPYVVAEEVKASVINAGDGWHAHPTQALLDLFTIKERLGRIAGLRVAIIGDILHSRVARSNLWGLTSMGANVVLCGPPTMLPAPAFCEGLPWNVERT